ncbi:unnamed protein product, partial [Prunus brigantina]
MAVKNPISSILNNYILDGTNYPGWLRKVKLVLKMDEIDYVLTHAPPHIHPDEEASQEEITAYEKHVKDDSRGKCYLLASMNDELLKQHEDMDDCASILLHLKELYGEATRSLRYNTICELVNAKMTRGTPVNQHGLKIISLLEKLDKLDAPFNAEVQQDFFLSSLSSDFSQFVMNYNMGKMESSLSELLNMAMVAEKNILKDKGMKGTVAVFEKGSSSSSKSKPKGKDKGKKKKGFLKPKKEKITKKSKEPKGTCFHCGKDGHWKR